MEISRLDAWYSDKDGNLECPATYIVKGLCCRCCLPEVILRCMQVSQQIVLTYIYIFCGCKLLKTQTVENFSNGSSLNHSGIINQMGIIN